MRRVWLIISSVVGVCVAPLIGAARIAAWPSPQAVESRVLFDIRLGRAASAILSDVEKRFGKPVREDFLPESDAMSGRNRVDSDGTPVVRVHPKHGRAEDVIYHELWHLKLKTDGYPSVEWLFPKDWNVAAMQAQTDWLAMNVWSPISHSIFYPAARRVGIDPNATPTRRVREMLRDGSLAKELALADIRDVAAGMFRYTLEFEDQALLREVRTAFMRDKRGVALGDKLAETVRRADPKTPEAAIEVLLDCLNLLYDGTYIFVPHPWRSRQLGTFTEPIARIEIRRRVEKAATSS